MTRRRSCGRCIEITDHVAPGRWEEVRVPNALELKQSSVLALPLQEVSAKIRSGPPLDDEADYALPIWAGVVPVSTQLGRPIEDGRVPAGVAGDRPGANHAVWSADPPALNLGAN